VVRTSRLVAALFGAFLISASPAVASTHHSSTHHTTGKTTTAKAPKESKATKARQESASTSAKRANRCTSCDRDTNGRILRSGQAKDSFKRATGYPKGRSGYVIDHIVPLACGGADVPSNMQWQTVAAAKAKDKVERSGCHR
jgi:hypothetical protein